MPKKTISEIIDKYRPRVEDGETLLAWSVNHHDFKDAVRDAYVIGFEEAKKAYGDCPFCYGSGLENAQPCEHLGCYRGKQIKEVIRSSITKVLKAVVPEEKEPCPRGWGCDECGECGSEGFDKAIQEMKAKIDEILKV